MRPTFAKTRTALVARLVALALVGAVAPASAAPLDSAEAVLGQWDVRQEGASRACRLTLRGERVKGGFYLGLPAGCRRAIAPFAIAAAWSLPGDERLTISDISGAPLIEFQLQADGSLQAIAATGEVYHMIFAAAPPPPPALPAPSPARPTVEAPARVAAKILRPTEVAGRYAVLRDGGRDTGCMVTLDPTMKAFLAPACRDQGIVTFDPTGWRLAGTRLVLVARKGHTTQLELQPDGAWIKDASMGKSLGLKRL